MVGKIQLIYNLSSNEAYQLYKNEGSITKALMAFNIKNDPRARQVLSRKITEITGNNMHSIKHRGELSVIDVDLVKCLASTASSFTDILRGLKLPLVGHNFSRIKTIIEQHNIQLQKKKLTKWADAQVYCQNSNFARAALRQRVFRDNWLEYFCAMCSNTGSWNGSKLVLQIDHINGINNDNRRNNLRWLCPNCHSQTPTFGGTGRPRGTNVGFRL